MKTLLALYLLVSPTTVAQWTPSPFNCSGTNSLGACCYSTASIQYDCHFPATSVNSSWSCPSDLIAGCCVSFVKKSHEAQDGRSISMNTNEKQLSGEPVSNQNCMPLFPSPIIVGPEETAGAGMK